MIEVSCSTTLFTVGTFPMVFVLKDSDENKIVAQMIQHGGGCIASSRGLYGICLSSPKNLQDKAAFSTEFIKDCCMANRILDINEYRLGDPSNYPDKVDAMKVLLRQSHWPTSAESDENESAQTDRHSDSDATTESQSSRGTNASRQNRTFSRKDEEEILHYIVENKEIGLVLGNTLWKKIAQKKVQGRTWQSLKKHFLKHILPNITKYTFLSVTDMREFQKHLQKTTESESSGDGGTSSQAVSQRNLEEQRSNRLPSLQKTTESETSGDGSTSSKAVSQRDLEEHRCTRCVPSPCAPSASNDGRSLEKNCGRRMPEKRKPSRNVRVVESSDSDIDSHLGNTDDQRLQDICQFHRATSSQVRHENKDNQHHRKQADPPHSEKNNTRIIERQQSDISSLDEVESGNEEHHRDPVVQRGNEERRKSSNNSSPDNDWFTATDRERHHLNISTSRHKPKSTRKKRREEFTMEEEYAILNYLQKHNRFSNTGGNNVWKNMTATEAVGKRHTWQSLRERYLKKIVPNINKYNLPEEIKRRIKYK